MAHMSMDGWWMVQTAAYHWCQERRCLMAPALLALAEAGQNTAWNISKHESGLSAAMSEAVSD